MLGAFAVIVIGGAVVAYVVHLATRDDWAPPTGNMRARPTNYPRITPPSRPPPPYYRLPAPSRPTDHPRASPGLDAVDVLILHDLVSHHDHHHHDDCSSSDSGGGGGSYDSGGDCGWSD